MACTNNEELHIPHLNLDSDENIIKAEIFGSYLVIGKFSHQKKKISEKLVQNFFEINLNTNFPIFSDKRFTKFEPYA